MLAKPWYASGVRRFGIANYCFAGLFMVAAALQFNDPDPAAWIAIYLGAAAACLSWGRHRHAWLLSAVMGTAALVWALTLMPEVIGKVGAEEFFESMDKKGGNAEIAREFGGQVIIGCWTAVLAITGFRDRTG